MERRDIQALAKKVGQQIQKVIVGGDETLEMRWDWDEILKQELEIEEEIQGNQLPTVDFSTYQTKEGLYIKFV